MSFDKLSFTNTGRALQAKALTGTALIFTKIALGAGELNGRDPALFTNLLETKVSLSISKITREDQLVTLEANFSNLDNATEFYWREVGLFANDPTLGEILYCYGNAASLAEHIPPSTSSLIEKVITISAVVGNVQNVSATINTSAFATKKEISDVNMSITEVNTQLAQIENQKISTGGIDIQRDLDKNISKIDQTMLADELLQQIAGTTPINAVPAVNSLTTDRYVDNSITTSKIKDAVESTDTPNNLIGASEYEIQEGYSYGSTGNKTVSSGFNAIVINVKQNGKIYIPPVYRIQRFSGIPSSTTYIEKIGGMDNVGAQTFDVSAGQYIALSVQISSTPNISDIYNSIKKNYRYLMENIDVKKENLDSVFGGIENIVRTVTINVLAETTVKSGYYANENGWNANATYTSYDYEVDEALSLDAYDINYNGGTLFSVSVYSGIVCKNNFIHRYLLSEVNISTIAPALPVGYHIVFSYSGGTLANVITMRRSTEKYFSMPYLLTDVNVITRIDNNNYEISIGNYTLNLAKRTTGTYTRWNILGIYFKNTEIVTPATDILGPIRESNNTWLGGVHGREQVDNFTIILDGRLFTGEINDVCIFHTLDIIQESTIHSSINESTCLTRFLRLTFKENKLTVENNYKGATVAGFTTSRAANGGIFGSPNTVVSAIVLTNKLYSTPPTATGTPSEVLEDVNNATYFYTSGNSITIENLVGKNYEHYSGLFTIYGDETPVRTKIYFNTIEGTSTILNLNDVLFGRFEYTFN